MVSGEMKSALADATAGTIGSLVAMLAFYPIDVWKTNLQAGRADASDGDVGVVRQRRSALSIARYVSTLFRGVDVKIIHTISSSFTYFFLYSFVKTKHEAYSLSRRPGTRYSPSTPTRLFLSAFAAMMNTTLTLPLDVLSARRQTSSATVDTDEVLEEKRNGECGEAGMREAMQAATDVRNELSSNGTSYDTADEYSSESDDSNDTEEEKKHDHGLDVPIARRGRPMARSPVPRIPSLMVGGASMPADLPQSERGEHWTSYWKGLMPSLLLCSNPSIHYTVFDIVKASVLQQKIKKGAGMEATSAKQRLSMWEAFLIGLLAKFVATIATYPLIRAKILLMVSPGGVGSNGNGTLQQVQEEGNEGKMKRGYNKMEDKGGHTMKGNASLTGLLFQIFRSDGINGIYKGCRLQLIHTALKSALLMMVKERINVVTRRVFLKYTPY